MVFLIDFFACNYEKLQLHIILQEKSQETHFPNRDYTNSYIFLKFFSANHIRPSIDFDVFIVTFAPPEPQ